MKKRLLVGLVAALPVFFATRSVLADSITVVSDATTLGAVDSDPAANFDTANVAGLTFTPVLVGAYGSFTPVPPDAPAGTQIVNIAPNADLGIGNSGYFEMVFTLPSTFSNVQLSGEANVDDAGRVFLNGNAITPSIFSGDAGVVTEFGNAAFSTSISSYFQAGQNVILISDDDNIEGGPSGGSFYATISFSPGNGSVPEPSTLLLYGQGAVVLIGCWWNRRRVRRS